ncbi:MAG: ABC transporter permease [Armatimonadetes bacterium]|uniref:ABC-2 family transporter protein n=1 Tax=Candidatus Nitrosymbiomonas proteolyticus TaxID=2608984 RepID=A0A809R585_9BACT|nr:MAG: ABC transporter permease [Armatimonadota bacterium]KXK20153.1 MAG: ABC-2 family transporter protein [Armatimonadetes bacterium OLB18]MBV6490232.1 hypothetical protein [Fimbriimonadaceae bacterium]QOJ11605.1 MAG: ABC transporter permease [Chthonomonadaceae bacterium]BBO22753.1 ABC-2 family transporter protein [Candidatus Nitrosymbiomonas proteolyticus]
MRVIYSIAATTVGEAIRRRVLLIILLIGLLLLSIIPGLSVLTARSQLSAIVSTMYAVLQGTSVLIAIILSIYMIPNEIERRTIYTILSKPVQRWQFLVGKYLGAVFALGLMMGLMTVVMLVLFYISQRPDMAKLAELAKGPVLYFVQVSLLAAVAIFFSTFVAPLVNFFLSIGLFMVGTILNPLYDSYSKSAEVPMFIKSASGIVLSILPNFSNYDVKNPIIHPEQEIGNETVYYLVATGYGLLYIGALLVAAILVFDRREV